MTDLTHEDLIKAMLAKSDQLNAVDLIAGPITVKIVAARKGSKEQPIVLEIEGWEGKPWKPCKTMLRIMAEVWKQETDVKMHPERWVGQSVTLYRDPDVRYGGDSVGGVRISHLTGINEPRSFRVAVTRGRTMEKIIYPIEVVSPEDQEYIDEAIQEFAEASTAEDLATIGLILKEKSAAIRGRLKAPYAARLAELKTD